VSRKHLGVRRRVRSGVFPNPETYSESREGLLAWCSFVDKGFELLEEEAELYQMFNEETLQAMSVVPCHSELFRYVRRIQYQGSQCIDIFVLTLLLSDTSNGTI
jgi:hypothetical protein